ncbi:MAG: DegT/DnrJ/EryC1/StrS family aminotransferase [Bacteroidota bacterium]
MNKGPIYVTQPYLPPLQEFNEYLQQIWDSKIITNNGPFHKQLEQKLCEYLGIRYISLFANGTLALITALQALKITGEVITTPYSFVASTHALWWNNIKPVFVDIEAETCNLNPEKIEEAITEHTTAILPVHVYGNPCKMEKIKQIADKHDLKVIYDAAHAFGVKLNNNSVLNFGDLSILSFHATKVFNTFEGGAIVCHSPEMKQHIDDLKNFGFRSEINVVAPGINAKMNEVQAAFGLLSLKYLNEAIQKRKLIADAYRKALNDTRGISFINDINDVFHNYSYFCIFIDESTYGVTRDDLYEKLKMHNIYSRRYFYPLISNFSPYAALSSANTSNLPVANKVAQEVLCLPNYPSLMNESVQEIVEIIKSTFR